MDPLSKIANINPALIIIAVVCAYVFFYFLRYNAGWLILGAWTILCLSFVLLSGGRAVIAHAQLLPGIIPRFECAGQAVSTRALWDTANSINSLSYCHFRGDGVDNIGLGPSAAADLEAERADLIHTYGS